MTTTVEAEASSREQNNATLIAALSRHDVHQTESTWEIDVINDTERGRWIAALGAEAIGELSYRFVGGRVVLISAWVDHTYRNHRVAGELISRALDEIRASGKTITIICPVVGEFIVHNRGYLDLIDKVHPGSGAYPRHETTDTPDGDHQIDAFVRDIT